MGWLTHSLNKYLSEGHCETYEEYVARLRRSNAPPISTTVDRMTQLEDDLARAVLIIHTLVEACVRKGVFTREEIAQVSAEVDLWDGVADGQLDPATVRPLPPPPPPATAVPTEVRWK
jgi:hypothetical protein